MHTALARLGYGFREEGVLRKTGTLEPFAFTTQQEYEVYIILIIMIDINVANNMHLSSYCHGIK